MSTPGAEARTRRVVSHRSGGMCEVRIPGVCSNQGEEMHHRKKPGRVWSPSNILHACRACHRWIEHNPTDAHDRGLWLMGAEQPLTAPVNMCWRGIMDWYRLTDTGGHSWPGRGPLAEGPDPERLQR